MNRIIKNDVTEILKDMEHTNTITFALNPMEQVEIDGEKFFARGFSCYSTEVILDGEEVCLNPLCYDGDLPTIKTKETWAFFNFEKIILYDNDKGFLGQLTKIIDPRNQQERLRDYYNEN